MEKEKTFFERTVSIRTVLFSILAKVETEQDLKTLQDATKELSDLCPNAHIHYDWKYIYGVFLEAVPYSIGNKVLSDDEREIIANDIMVNCIEKQILINNKINKNEVD